MKACGPALTVRKAVAGDREAICQVHVASIRGLCRSHYSSAQIASWSGRLKPESYDEVLRTRAMVVACAGDRVVGFGQLNIDAAEIEAVYVAPDRARRGAGARILASLEQIALSAGLTHLYLRATLNAVPFYEKLGYARGALIPCPLAADLTVPCVEMRKRLELP